MEEDKDIRVSTSGSISFSYMPTFYEIEDENIDLVVLTTEGDLIEYSGNEVNCSCNLCPANTALIVLQIFYTYGPDFKYYLVLIRDQLFVVKKENRNKLEVVKIVNSVSHFSTEDSNNDGQPQVLLWTGLNTNPSILNLYIHYTTESGNTGPKQFGEACLKIKSHVQIVDGALKYAERLLVDKKALVSRLSLDHRIKSPCETSEHASDEIPLIAVFGEQPVEKTSIRKDPISLGKPWFRISPNYLVVGLHVSNVQERMVRNLELTAINSDLVFEKTVTFATAEGFDFSGDLGCYNPVNFMPPYTHGYIVGTLLEPVFLQKSITLCIVLTFDLDDGKGAEQIYVGEVQIPHEDMIFKKNLPFDEQKEVADLLSLLVICEKKDIVFNKNEDDLSPVSSSLKSAFINLGFIELSDNLFIQNYEMNTAFCGMVLQIHFRESCNCGLSVYHRKVQQLFLLVVTLRNNLSSHGYLEKRSLNSAYSMLTAMLEEIRILKKYLVAKASISEFSGDSISISVDKYLLSKLLILERNTDAITL